MSSIATLVFASGILVLFALYRDPQSRPSPALWLPTIWVGLAGSRMVSVWLNPSTQLRTASMVGEGNPLDRLVLTALMMAGLVILLCRLRRVVKVLKMNWPLLLFFGYCAVSAMWSDVPGLALKRWVKAIGDVVMVLIILTDRQRMEAIKRVITRVGFVLMPLSVLMIEFYPRLGRSYSLIDGTVTNTGVTTNKNMLGVICLIVGLGCTWLFIKALHDSRRKKRQVLALGATLATVSWLFVAAHSMTSLFCFMLGATVLVLVNMPAAKRPSNIHLVIGGMVSAAALVFVFPQIFVSIVQLFGKNATLTGRTELWKTLLSMDTHPWLGTGFESFWIGDRLAHLWAIFSWQPNEAHNGYLEVYLNLGMIGLGLLALLLGTGYRHLVAVYRRNPEAGSLRLALFTAAVAYSFAEAGFRMLDPMWIFLLLAIIAVPEIPRKDLELPLEPSQHLVRVELPQDEERIYERVF